MKRLTTAISILAIILCFTACGKADLQAGQPNIEPTTTENSIILYGNAPFYQTLEQLNQLNVWISGYTYEMGLWPDEIHYSFNTIDQNNMQQLLSDEDADDFLLTVLGMFDELASVDPVYEEVEDYLYEDDYIIDFSIWPQGFDGFTYYGQVTSENINVTGLSISDFLDYEKTTYFTKLPYGKTLLVNYNRDYDYGWALLYAGNGQLEAITSFDS